MKFTLEIDLDTTTVKTGRDIYAALEYTFANKLLPDMAPAGEGEVWDGHGNTVGHWHITEPLPTAKTAEKTLHSLMRKYANYGAQDSEGYATMRQIETAAQEGQPFPLVPSSLHSQHNFPFNPWELYESVPGWEQASSELLQTSLTYYKALVKEQLGVSLA